MNRLKYVKNQFYYINVLLLFTCIISLYSCEKEDNLPIESNQEYLGNQNTIHEYKTTIWRLKPDSNIPFLNVPDSLINKLSIDSLQISEGVIEKNYRSQTLVPVDTTWYQNNSYPELTNGALHSNYSMVYYKIEREIENILNGKEYKPSVGSGINGPGWVENDTVMGYISGDQFIFSLKKPLIIGNDWVRSSYTHTDQYGDLKLRQKICTVISKEQIDVEAGTFLAYKVAISRQTIDAKSTDNKTYEYYVPSVGLILKEYDMNLYQAQISTSGETTTIYFRQKYIKELVSYSFIQNQQ